MTDDLNLDRLEHHALTLALERTHGHVGRAAGLLGVSVKTAYNMAHRYGLPLPRRRIA